MKYNTKLWKRSNKSFATTIPHPVLFKIDESKDYEVIWDFDPVSQKWSLDFIPISDIKISKNKGAKKK